MGISVSIFNHSNFHESTRNMTISLASSMRLQHFFYLIGFALSPSTRYEMYQKHLVGVHNGADRTQVKLLPPSTHISTSPHLCSLSPSSSWGTLTHPPKPNSNVPYLRKPALLPCGGDGSSLLLPNQSGHSSTQVH